MNIFENTQIVEQEIKNRLEKSGRNSQDLTVVAVTKTSTTNNVKKLYQLGYRNFAENRVENLLEKQDGLVDEDIKWHFIGTLQTRKVKDIINDIDYFHALDRISLAKEIEKRANHMIACFVQVNVTGETSKQGVSPDNLETFILSLEDFPHIQVVGLMTMAPLEASESDLRNCFRSLKDLQTVIESKRLSYAPCTEVSMGMSNDFGIAIEEGSTFVRIGSAFFK